MTSLSLLLDQTVKGKKHQFNIPIAELPDGTPVHIPVMIIRGNKEGPTLCLSGVVHGDEYNGISAISRLFNQIDPGNVAGHLIGVPLMNPMAFFTESRLNILDYELQNLNRIFPGNPEGDLGQRMAHKLFDEIFSKADVIIDYHEGGRDFMAKYLLIKEAQGGLNKSRQLAEWFGHNIPVAVTLSSAIKRRPGYNGSLSAAAGALNIPALAVELGGSGRVWEEFVSLAVAGTLNIMIGLEMIEGEISGSNNDQIFSEIHDWPRPTHAGLLVPEPGIELNVIVEEGQNLASIYNPFGEVIEEIKAPYPSVLLDTRHSAVVYPGDWTYHCGKLP